MRGSDGSDHEYYIVQANYTYIFVKTKFIGNRSRRATDCGFSLYLVSSVSRLGCLKLHSDHGNATIEEVNGSHGKIIQSNHSTRFDSIYNLTRFTPKLDLVCSGYLTTHQLVNLTNSRTKGGIIRPKAPVTKSSLLEQVLINLIFHPL